MRSIVVDGVSYSGDKEISEHLAHQFSVKYGSKLPHLWCEIPDFAHRAEGCCPPFDELEVSIALEKLRRPTKLDSEGLCVDLLAILFEADQAVIFVLVEVCDQF